MSEVIKKVGTWVSLVVGVQAFLKQVWKYLALIFAGVIAGLVYSMKQIKPIQHIQTQEFINEQSKDTQIGKLKQKGQGNVMDVELPEFPEQSKREARKEIRLERREKRREKRKGPIVLPIIVLLTLFGFQGYSQSGMKERFEQYMSALDSTYKAQEANDLRLFNETKAIFESSKDSIHITGELFLMMYWAGYINGSENALKKGSFDFEELKADILNNKKAMDQPEVYK